VIAQKCLYGAAWEHRAVFLLWVAATQPADGSGHGLVVRVHQGEVHVGDRIGEAQPPAGKPVSVDLVVTDLAMAGSVHVESLESNFGGLAVVEGTLPQAFGEGWTLAG
jgi:hypothetical protein